MLEGSDEIVMEDIQGESRSDAVLKLCEAFNVISRQTSKRFTVYIPDYGSTVGMVSRGELFMLDRHLVKSCGRVTLEPNDNNMPEVACQWKAQETKAQQEREERERQRELHAGDDDDDDDD